MCRVISEGHYGQEQQEAFMGAKAQTLFSIGLTQVIDPLMENEATF
jgi:hypothetical protein